MVIRQIQFDSILKALRKINANILLGKNKNILKGISNSAMKVFEADSCRIVLYDADSRSFVAEASAGVGTSWKFLPRADGIGAKVLETGNHLWVDDINKINPVVAKEGLTCVGCFPLQPKGGKQIGVLYLHYYKNPRFTKSEHNIVYQFSYQAGLAIQLSEHREEERKHIKHLEALRDVIIDVAQFNTLREALDRVVHGTVQVMQADAALLHPWDENGQTFDDLVVSTGLSKRVKLVAPRPSGLTDTILRTGILCEENIDNISDDHDLPINMLQKYILSVNHLKSFIGIPLRLKSDNEPLGVLYIFYREPHRADDEEIAEIKILADLASAQIRLAQLSEVRRKEAEDHAMGWFNIAAAQFGHRLANVAGTVPIVLDDIEERLQTINLTDKQIFNRLADLRKDTRSLLDMASYLRLETIPKSTSINLVSVINNAIKAAHLHSINPHVRIEKDLPRILKKVNVNAVEFFLNDLIVNLLQNAAQANAKSIRIRVVVRHEDGMVDLYISDDGDGMSEAELSKIFTPFYNTEPKRNLKGKKTGLGLGLWIVYRQINQMGGTISVESVLGSGTTFTISLRIS